MPQRHAPITGKPPRAASLSTTILAVICEHTQDPWEVDPTDPSRAILRRPILELVRELLPEAEVKVKPAKKAGAKPKAPVKKPPPKPTKAKKPATKAPSKPTPKPSKAPTTKPTTREEKRQVILALFKLQNEIKAKQVHYLFGTGKSASNRAGAFLKAMVADGLLERHGLSRGSSYTLAVAEPVKKPPAKPTPTTDQELNAAILEILADGKEHKAADFYGLWGSLEEAREEFPKAIGWLVMLRQVVKTGKGSGTRYALTRYALKRDEDLEINPETPPVSPRVEGDLGKIFGIDLVDEPGAGG